MESEYRNAKIKLKVILRQKRIKTRTHSFIKIEGVVCCCLMNQFNKLY